MQPNARTIMNKPNYRLRVEIYDQETGEKVYSEDDALYADRDNHTMQLYRVLEYSKNMMPRFEETHYPDNHQKP